MGQARVIRVAAALLALAGLLAAVEPAAARHRMSFTPGRHGGGGGGYHHRGHRSYATHGRRHGGRGARAGGAGRSGSAGADAGGTVTPPPGSGFKMEDGVLTYPAPARFQPKNLKHP